METSEMLLGHNDAPQLRLPTFETVWEGQQSHGLDRTNGMAEDYAVFNGLYIANAGTALLRQEIAWMLNRPNPTEADRDHFLKIQVDEAIQSALTDASQTVRTNPFDTVRLLEDTESITGGDEVQLLVAGVAKHHALESHRIRKILVPCAETLKLSSLALENVLAHEPEEAGEAIVAASLQHLVAASLAAYEVRATEPVERLADVIVLRTTLAQTA